MSHEGPRRIIHHHHPAGQDPVLAEMATRYIIGISPSLVMEAVLYCLRSYLACQVSLC